MKNSSTNLDDDWDLGLELGTQELLGGVELTHSPDSRNHNGAIISC